LKLNLALALVVGLVLNSFLALLGEILRDPLPEGSQLEELLNNPILATVPTLEFIQPRVDRPGWRRSPKARRRVDQELGRARTLGVKLAAEGQGRTESTTQIPPSKSEGARR
jgi:hypothetical protein